MGQGNADAFFCELIPYPLEVLVIRERDWAGIAVTLHFSWWILHVSSHYFFYLLLHHDAHPSPLGEVVHEDVVSLLRIGPEIEYLRDSGHVFVGTLPAQIAIDGESAGRRAVVAAQIENK